MRIDSQRAYGPAHQLLRNAFGFTAVSDRLSLGKSARTGEYHYELFLSPHARCPLLRDADALQKLFKECGVISGQHSWNENDVRHKAFLITADSLCRNQDTVQARLEQALALQEGALAPASPQEQAHEVVSLAEYARKHPSIQPSAPSTRISREDGTTTATLITGKFPERRGWTPG